MKALSIKNLKKTYKGGLDALKGIDLDVEEGDLEETKGIYQKILSFFSKDTKEPLIICALVFLMCLPFVNQMLTKYVPFLVKDGNLGMGAIATKAIVAGVLFFVVKKFL